MGRGARWCSETDASDSMRLKPQRNSNALIMLTMPTHTADDRLVTEYRYIISNSTERENFVMMTYIFCNDRDTLFKEKSERS